MKVFSAFMVLMAVSYMGFAEAPANTQNGTQTPGAASTTTRPAGSAAPNAQAPTPATGRHVPVAKTQDEYKAYLDAAAKPDAPSAEAAADAFAQKFPDSELRGALYQHVMLQYQGANNSDKVVELGRKTLQAEPDNAIALAIVASTLSVRTHDTDLDRDERFEEAKKDANKAIELANAGEAAPAGTSPEQAALYKDTIIATAYSALGSIDFNNKNYGAAEQNLRKAVEPSHAQPDAVNYYQLALTLQREGKNSDALETTGKCVEVAKDNPAVANVCKTLQSYLQKLVSNPPAQPAPGATTPQPK
jgi:tetratricopeptide (TPR) repeat protein